MSQSSPDMPQHLLLAFDHHTRLLEDAQRQRLVKGAHRSTIRRLPRWRRLRFRLGELLISAGQRLKTDTAWG